MPVSQADLARALGVSRAAVSMALRQHPRISRALCARVRQAAERMGYVPNQHWSFIMSERRRGRRASSSCLAYVDDFGGERPFANRPNGIELYRALTARAEELGFRVERFSLPDLGAAGKDLAAILDQRGIEGVVLGPTPAGSLKVRLDWTRVCAVAGCFFYRDRPVHRVIPDAFQAMESATHRLRAAGYRQIALAMPAVENEHTGHLFIGGYLTQCERDGQRPLFWLPQRPTLRAFHEWWDRHRPDAIFFEGLPALQWLRQMRVDVPRTTALARLATPPARIEGSLAGFRQPARAAGAMAAEILVQNIVVLGRNAAGSASTRLLPMEWQPGWSMPEPRN